MVAKIMAGLILAVVVVAAIRKACATSLESVPRSEEIAQGVLSGSAEH
jgi:hypothetical protein